MSEIARSRPTFGDRYGHLRVLRSDGTGARVFCICQRSFTVATADLIAGVATCPRCEELSGQAQSLIADGGAK